MYGYRSQATKNSWEGNSESSERSNKDEDYLWRYMEIFDREEPRTFLFLSKRDTGQGLPLPTPTTDSVSGLGHHDSRLLHPVSVSVLGAGSQPPVSGLRITPLDSTFGLRLKWLVSSLTHEDSPSRLQVPTPGSPSRLRLPALTWSEGGRGEGERGRKIMNNRGPTLSRGKSFRIHFSCLHQ